MKKWDQKSFSIYAHFKRDGINIVVRDDQVLTRKPQDWRHKLEWHPCIKKMLNLGIEFHCECWLPYKRASSVITAIIEQNHNLRVDVYCVPHLGNCQLYEVADYCDEVELQFIPYLMHGESLLSMSDKNDWMVWKELNGCRGGYYGLTDFTVNHQREDGGLEGFVLKDSNLGEMQKFKLTQSIDLIVEDLKPGKGRHAGVIGALICKTYEGHIIANVGGLSDYDRNRDDWIGKVIEVGYQYVGAKGKLRHPTFVRVRDDKPAEECTVSQDFELEEYYND